MANNSANSNISSSYLTQRVSLLTGRTFSVALLATFAEASFYAFAQREYIQPLWFWLTWGLVLASVLTVTIEYWFFNGGNIGLIAHAVAVCLTLFTWQFQLSGLPLPTDFRPWIWWQFGIGVISAGLGFVAVLGWILIFAVPLYWVFFRMQVWSGGPDPMRAVQDGVYSALLAAVVVSLVKLLKTNAKKADDAAIQAQEAMVNQAQADAVERERLRIDALVHEKILATLESAYVANHNAEHPQIAASAAEALQSLRDFGNVYGEPKELVTVQNLFDALGGTAKQHFGEFKVVLNGEGSPTLDIEVANAFSEATMQALDNSLKHAGGKLVKRNLHLRVKQNGFKIVIEDDGRGFRPSRVAKDRLGVRRTIRGRVESVGGKVKIDSAPGQGTRVILEWDMP